MVTASTKKDCGVMLSLLVAGVLISVGGVESFSTTPSIARTSNPYSFDPSASTIHGRNYVSGSALFAAGGKKKRRRRKRKEGAATAAAAEPQKAAATTTSSSPEPPAPPAALEARAAVVPEPPVVVANEDPTASVSLSTDADGEEFNVADIKSVAGFSFDGPLEAPPQQQSVEEKAAVALPDIVQEEDGSIPLPDIRDTLKRKKMGETADKPLMEDNMPKTKIDRTDREALLKLLEQDPYADGDDSFFFEQDYTSISAWLGEGTKPFLGIPTGPLQVGHTIGALVIVLMAFIEYPGFPLTNLPTPLRGALQGGLGTIYGINALLCVVAFFKAQERGQSVPIWVAKTLTVGGLALDQLSQLPTIEQVEKAKARKGKRALRNMKK